MKLHQEAHGIVQIVQIVRYPETKLVAENTSPQIPRSFCRMQPETKAALFAHGPCSLLDYLDYLDCPKTQNDN